MSTEYAVVLPTTGLMGVRDFLGTERANDEPSETFDERRQRCYELAGYAVAFGLAPRGSRVVHGSWHGPEAPERIGHAWVVLPKAADGTELVWEPITAAVYDATEFYRRTRAWPEVEYDLHVLRRMLASHGHYGRWHESRYP